MPEIRVCYALGTWQLIVLAAAMKQADQPGQNILVLYEQDEVEELRGWMETFAGILGRWDRIVWANDILTRRPTSEAWPIPVRRLSEQLRDRIGNVNPDEIWITHLESFAEKLVAETYPGARIVFYEDGLGSYIDRELARGEDSVTVRTMLEGVSLWARGKLHDHLASKKLSNWRIPKAYHDRVGEVWLCLSDILEVPVHMRAKTAHQISRTRVLDVLATATQSDLVSTALENLESFNPDGILFLGEAIHDAGTISHSDECDVYREVIERLIDKVPQVYWKEHPRNSAPFWEDLKQAVNSDRFGRFECPSQVPVEIALSTKRVKACISGHSTSLLYAGWLFDIPAYNMIDNLRQRMDKDSVITGEALIKKHIPSWESMRT